MNRFRSMTIAALLIIGALAAGAAYAQGPGGPGGRGGFGPRAFGGVGLPLRALNLSDAQEQQLRTLRQQFRDQSRSAAEKFRAAMLAQRNAVAAIPVDEPLIRSTSQALADAQTELALQQARLQSEIFGLLTPEQQAQAKKLQAEREARVQQRARPRNN